MWVWDCPGLTMVLQIRTEKAVVIVAQIPFLPAGMQHHCIDRLITSQMCALV